MPRKPKDGETFDPVAYRQEWNRQNMKSVGASFKADFVIEYKEAAKKFGMKTSDLIRQMMQDVIDRSKEQENS